MVRGRRPPSPLGQHDPYDGSDGLNNVRSHGGGSGDDNGDNIAGKVMVEGTVMMTVITRKKSLLGWSGVVIV